MTVTLAFSSTLAIHCFVGFPHFWIFRVVVVVVVVMVVVVVIAGVTVGRPGRDTNIIFSGQYINTKRLFLQKNCELVLLVQNLFQMSPLNPKRTTIF